MDEANIRKYAKLMREEDLSGLEITEDGVTVRLERAVAENVIQVPQAAAAAPAAAAEKSESTDDSSYVTSPMVGVAYLAPTENSDPYVKLGDKVKAGDILCIVEAMKLMNMIQTEIDGTIAEICITDGQVVEYGTKLFRIER
ncbi:MAG: acetyl-CoA carboxylase biotin carboxyl carrier protein [Lachnospiraceae bacterium]|nr:acetyl-CoA carboxylase biotin carboxyl carrier protein [Lachnospiraceae bacterium]MBR3004505.1 acetyl-CoA carboxylase biotin carboxyl carrier protein [Lachnospiraceae bacterium]